MWQETTGAPTHESSTWTVSAWETKQACEQALAQKVRSDSAPRDGSKGQVTVDDQAGKQRVWWRTKTKDGATLVMSTWQHPWVRIERLIRSFSYQRWDKATRPKAKKFWRSRSSGGAVRVT